MQITRTTRTKYYLLGVLGAVVVAMGLLAIAPYSVQAQQTEPTVDKECTPNPVQIGQQLTCTIDVVPGFNLLTAVVIVEDTFPAGVTPTSATAEGGLVECQVSGNTVTCESIAVSIVTSIRVTIDATAQQCGTFQNTATARASSLSTGQELFNVTDTEEIIVVGCEEPLPPAPPGQQEGASAPITQEGEQESEAGEIDQSFDVS